MAATKIYLTVFTLFLSFVCMSQENTSVTQESDTIDIPDVIQFSGVLVTGDSLLPVPYSNVYRTRDNTGVISNALDFFTLPAFEGDTIMFSNVGYRNIEYVIPDEVEGNMLSIVQFNLARYDSISGNCVYPLAI